MWRFLRICASLLLFAAGVFLLVPAPSSFGPYEYEFHWFSFLAFLLLASAMLFAAKSMDVWTPVFAIASAGMICVAMNIAAYVPTM